MISAIVVEILLVLMLYFLSSKQSTGYLFIILSIVTHIFGAYIILQFLYDLSLHQYLSYKGYEVAEIITAFIGFALFALRIDGKGIFNSNSRTIVNMTIALLYEKPRFDNDIINLAIRDILYSYNNKDWNICFFTKHQKELRLAIFLKDDFKRAITLQSLIKNNDVATICYTRSESEEYVKKYIEEIYEYIDSIKIIKAI